MTNRRVIKVKVTTPFCGAVDVTVTSHFHLIYAFSFYRLSDYSTQILGIYKVGSRQPLEPETVRY